MFELVASKLSFEISNFYQQVTLHKKLGSTPLTQEYLLHSQKKDEKLILQISQNPGFIPDYPRTLQY